MSDYTYDARLVRVVDGDTVILSLALGFHVSVEETFRVYGINTPEKIGDTKKEGLAASAFMAGLFNHCNFQVEVRTHKGQEKYGRWLCEICGKDSAGNVLNFGDEMIKAGHAVEYFGGKRE